MPAATRALAAAYGVGALGVASAYVPLIPVQLPAYHAPWLAGALVITFLLPLATLLATAAAPVVVLRRVLAADGLLGALVLWTLPLGLRIPLETIDPPWVVMAIPASTVAMAIAGHGRTAWLLSVLNGVAVCLDRVLAGPPGIGATALRDGIWSTVLTTVIVGLVMLTQRATRELDTATGTARAELREAAQRQVERDDRRWSRQFLHDEVLSVLILADREDPELREVARRRARSALEILAGPGPGPGPGPVATASAPTDPSDADAMPVRVLLARLRETAADIGPGTTVAVDLDGELVVPGPVRATLLAAVGEALRNSVRHAGPHAERRLSGTAGPAGLRLAVEDDGQGFDPGRVGADRMGMAESVLAGMRRLPGGDAEVRSARGRGTVVTLSWTPGT